VDGGDPLGVAAVSHFGSGPSPWCGSLPCGGGWITGSAGGGWITGSAGATRPMRR